MAGSDMKILIYHAQDRGAAFIETMDGPIIGIFHKYVYYGMGKSILSLPQLESYENQVMCTSREKCVLLSVVTRDGWIILLHIRGGRTYMDMRPPTDYEFNNYDHVAFISDVAWDPKTLENETDLTALNKNLILNRADEFVGARLPDTGEKGI